MSELLVVGAGEMSGAYVRVLKELGIDFSVVGRSETSTAKLRDKHHVVVHIGGLETYLAHAPAPKSAIVAVPVQDLATSTCLLGRAGTERILVEKPGALNTNELDEMNACISSTQAKIWVAYNRRFLQSTLTVREMIQADGGTTSFFFEFTEWVDNMFTSPLHPQVKEAWVVANSSHVIDLAFFLGGTPTELAAWTQGSLPWHQSGDRFTGAGRASNGALFSYRSDWLSPGRWRVEISTVKRRLLLSPLETVQQMVHGSLEFEVVDINNDVDIRFKPGLFCQTKAFIEGPTDKLCSLEEHLQGMRLYERIAGYSDRWVSADMPT